MEDPCKECGPRVDPYDCWFCPNIEGHRAYIREILSDPCRTCRHGYGASESCPCEAKDICNKNTEEE